MTVTALIGNGLAMSYNPDLSVSSLTTGLLHQFRQADNNDLRAIAEDVDEDDQSGFEDLLGPFDAVSAMIGGLPGIRSSGGGWAPGFDALGRSLEAAREIHQRGSGIALHVIADRSQAEGDFQPVDDLCSAIAELDSPGNLAVATLNYDGLLAAGFLQEGIYEDWTVRRTLPTSDMGDGRTEETIETDFSEGDGLRTWELRRIPDFMENRARLLNLHGSLGWLRNSTDSQDVRRFQIPDLRRLDFWKKNARGETRWEPVVVLTSRKTDLVQEWPFALCYSEFLRALTRSDRWLIAGYGLGDEPVNAAFHAAVRARQRLKQETRVLVVGLGDGLRLRDEASRHLGIPISWSSSSADGIREAVQSSEWEAWASR